MKPEGNTEGKYVTLLNKIFELPDVRYAAVNDKFGVRIVGGMKPGVKTLTPPEADKRLEMQSVMILKMAENYSEHSGELRYSSIQWAKVCALFFLISPERALCITVFGDLLHDTKLKIERIVSDWKGMNRT